MINTEDEIHYTLVMAKSRVTPKKVLTMPRLELMADATTVNISNSLREELQYNKCEEYYWTDSQIVFSYIHNNARITYRHKWITMEILQTSEYPAIMYHVALDLGTYMDPPG